MRGILAFIAGVTSVLLAAPPGPLVTEARAQQETATVIGTVRDSQQAALPGATVTVKNVDTGFTRTGMSDDQGRYRIAAIPPGAYELSAELAGFATALRKGVTLTLGAEAVLNFELSVASVTEQVSVTADTPVIETTTAAVQGTMRREQIDLLPVIARDYTNVIRLMPGAAANNSTYGFAGSRGRSNTWNVDGVDNSDEISGYAHQSPALDSIQEIQVLANGFKAEYGQASGGVVNVITRSGTNQVRGSGFALFQDESLRARSPYANRSQPEDPFQRIQYGATIGGPIQRDKMHFFGTYEREDRDTTSISTRTLPASNANFSTATRQFLQAAGVDLALFGAGGVQRHVRPEFVDVHKATVRVDRQRNSNQYFTVRWLLDDKKEPSGFGGTLYDYNGCSPTCAPTTST